MRQIGVSIVAALLVAFAVVVWLGGPPDTPEPVPVAPVAPVAPPAPAAPPAPGEPAALPEGALPPILGPRRSDDARFCDDALWQAAGTIVRAVRLPDEATVDEREWQSRGASARAGLASWISKCRFQGGAVRLVADGTGKPLASYDAESGYREH